MANVPKKILLTGYRATGKSSVGLLLAQKLDWEFVDTDRDIEKNQDCPIRQIVSQRGWKFFRELEQKLLQEYLSRDQVVIASGGGAILHQKTWQQLKKNAVIIWLTADPQTICNRLAGDGSTAGQRPSLSGQDIYTEVQAVLAERTPLYRAGSHVAIDTSISVPKIVEKILLFVKKSVNVRVKRKCSNNQDL